MSEPLPDSVPITWGRRSGTWITVAGLVLALAVGLGAVAVRQYESRLRTTGLVTSATVTEILRIRLSYNVNVRFTTTAGQVVTARLDDFPRDPQLKVGDELRIRYDPDRPDVTLWDVRDPPDFTGATIFLVSLAAVLALAFVLFFLFTRRRGRRPPYAASS
jgi:hypothetical protein